jgi:hypothetical protein
MSPRVLSVLGGLLWLLAASLGPENSYHGVNHPGDRLNKSRQVSPRVWWMRECARLEFYSIPSSRHLGRAGGQPQHRDERDRQKLDRPLIGSWIAE